MHQQEVDSFLDTLDLDLINIIIPSRQKEIKIRPQSTEIVLLGESHYATG